MPRIILFILAFTTIACTNDELCVGNGTNELKISFIESGSDPESPESIAFDSIGVSGEPIDYPSFADTTLSEIALTVDPDSLITRFVFYTTDRTDTLDVSYKITSSLISVQCGPELLYSKLDTIYHTYDSLVIVQNLFDTEVDTNLKIYY